MTRLVAQDYQSIIKTPVLRSQKRIFVVFMFEMKY
jgi:hypothetical protein